MRDNKNNLHNIEQHKGKQRLDVDATKSERRGILGLFETCFRSFRQLSFVLLLSPIAIMYVFCLGLAIAPALMVYDKIQLAVKGAEWYIYYPATGMSLGAGYFIFAICLVFVVPAVNKLLPLKIKPCRTTWYSLNVIPWYYHNALTYLVRYTVLDLMTPTPITMLFFKMMGMKLGKGSIINTSNISDPCLIEIGDYVTIGGSATLIAHYGMKGLLIIDKLVIKDKATND